MTTLTTPIIGDWQTASFSDETAITFAGQTYKPDATKGYFTFKVSTAFPKGATQYGTAVFAGTIGRSWQSIIHQNVNFEHRLRVFHKEPGKDCHVPICDRLPQPNISVSQNLSKVRALGELCLKTILTLRQPEQITPRNS
jgi:hypothetical protein